jgi:hypothetical protein
VKGNGIASALAKFAFAYAGEQKKKVKVYCPFAAAYIKWHPEPSKKSDAKIKANKPLGNLPALVSLFECQKG